MTLTVVRRKSVAMTTTCEAIFAAGEKKKEKKRLVRLANQGSWRRSWEWQSYDYDMSAPSQPTLRWWGCLECHLSGRPRRIQNSKRRQLRDKRATTIVNSCSWEAEDAA